MVSMAVSVLQMDKGLAGWGITGQETGFLSQKFCVYMFPLHRDFVPHLLACVSSC